MLAVKKKKKEPTDKYEGRRPLLLHESVDFKICSNYRKHATAFSIFFFFFLRSKYFEIFFFKYITRIISWLIRSSDFFFGGGEGGRGETQFIDTLNELM